jgi:hypothetical protein
MTTIYIAFYDDEEGGARENWNTFYTPWVAATTPERARRLAEEAIAKMVVDYILKEYDVDLNEMSIDDIDDEILRDEVREEYDTLINRYDIEIQSGELE